MRTYFRNALFPWGFPTNIFMYFLFLPCAPSSLCFSCFLMSVLLNNTFLAGSDFGMGRFRFFCPSFHQLFAYIDPHHREKLLRNFLPLINSKVHYRVHKGPPLQNVAVEWLAFLVPIRAIPGINLCPKPRSPELGLSSLVSYSVPQAHAGIVPLVRLQPLPSASFSIHYSLIILSFDAT
jgi:hypothetical protein